MDGDFKVIMTEFKNTMLEKFDEVNKKIDTVNDNLNKKIDDVNNNLNKKIDDVNNNLNKKIDDVNDNLNKKIDYVDKKQTNNFKSLSEKLDYANNNVALILQEQIKMREEMKQYNEINEKQHRIFEYEIKNLKTYVL